MGGGGDGQDHGRQMESVVSNPFLAKFSGTKSPSQLPVNDPFLPHAQAHGTYGGTQGGQQLGAGMPGATAKKTTWLDYCTRLAPWLVFICVLSLWMFFRHLAPTLVVILTFTIAVLAAGAAATGVHNNRAAGPHSDKTKSILGILCFFAVVLGCGVGIYGWNGWMRQYWWIRTGAHYEGTPEKSPAAARAGASWIHFIDPDLEGSTSGSPPPTTAMVDNTRSAGFRNSSIFCVAPVLDAATAFVSLPRVDYWAIGIDCCQKIGNFECDDSREYLPGGGYGIVMIEDDMPCPGWMAGCDGDMFRAAVRKAEAAHNLVSAPGALFVRYVRNPDVIEDALRTGGILLFVISALIVLICFCALEGWLFRRYGYQPPGSAIQGPPGQKAGDLAGPRDPKAAVTSWQTRFTSK